MVDDHLAWVSQVAEKSLTDKLVRVTCWYIWGGITGPVALSTSPMVITSTAELCGAGVPTGVSAVGVPCTVPVTVLASRSIISICGERCGMGDVPGTTDAVRLRTRLVVGPGANALVPFPFLLLRIPRNHVEVYRLVVLSEGSALAYALGKLP